MSLGSRYILYIKTKQTKKKYPRKTRQKKNQHHTTEDMEHPVVPDHPVRPRGWERFPALDHKPRAKYKGKYGTSCFSLTRGVYRPHQTCLHHLRKTVMS